MKIRDILKTIEIKEARVPGLDYKETPVSKTDLTIDKVTLTLKAKDSEVFTKIAKAYKECDDLEKQVKAKRDELNKQVKSKMAELFDAADVWYTRVIETISVTLNLAKQSESTLPSVEMRVNYEKTANELLELLQGELLEKGKLILAKNTEIVRLAGVEAKSPALRVKLKDSIDYTLNESTTIEALQAWSKKFLGWFKSWGKQYDQKLSAVNAQVKALGAK